MKLRCNLIEADKPTANGRVYPRETLEEAIKEFNDKDEEVGTLGSNADLSGIDVNKASHKIKDLWLDEDGHMEAEVEILDTLLGNCLKQVDSSLLKISPTFIATVSEDLVVNIESIQHISITIP